MEKVYKPTLISGEVFARAYGTNDPLLSVGNVDELKLSHDEEVKKLKDRRRSSGGSYAKAARLNGINITMQLRDINKTNLSRALKGAATTVEAGSVTGEVHSATKGELVRLAHAKPSAVVVTNNDASTTYELGRDYEVRGGGLYIPETTTMVDGADVKINYSYAAYDVIQAFTNSGQDLELYFEGMNEADSDNPVLIDIWRASFGAAKEVDVLGDDFQALALEGELIADASKGSGKSAFYQQRQV